MQNFSQLTRRLAFLFAFAIWTSTDARAELVYGITSTNQLVGFDSATPGIITSNVSVTGVIGNFVGIDFRPANGGLYGLGNNAGAGTVYLINPMTGVASSVYTLTTALSGTNFGVDFNPVPDALRIVSDTGQNLRIAGFPTNIFTTNVDGALSLTGVVGAGYTNNFPGAATTTLYDIRSTDSSLYTQSPPNAGTLNLVGALGTATNASVGFDISGATATAFASLNGGTNFGTVNLATGAFTNFGSIGGGFAGQIVDISVTAVPEPSSVILISGGLVLIAVHQRYRRLRRRSMDS
jgi:hypothetical protein